LREKRGERGKGGDPVSSAKYFVSEGKGKKESFRSVILTSDLLRRRGGGRKREKEGKGSHSTFRSRQEKRRKGRGEEGELSFYEIRTIRNEGGNENTI